MEKLLHLLNAAHAMSPGCEVRFRGTDAELVWVIIVAVGGMIIFESKPGSLEEVVDVATSKLKGVSTRIAAAFSEEPDD